MDNKTFSASSAVSPLGPSRKVRAAIRKAVKHIDEYSDSAKKRLLRQLCSRHRLPEESILLSSSLEELLFCIAFAVKPQHALIIGPTLTVYEKKVAALGASVEYLMNRDMAGSMPDLQSLERSVKNADILFIASPCRISGSLPHPDLIATIVSLAGSHGCRVVIDESLIEFTDHPGLFSAAGADHVIVVRTTAFYYGLPGLELAYASSTPQTITMLQNVPAGSLNLLAIEAARCGFRDAAYRRLLKQHVSTEKEMFLKSLSALKGTTIYESDANILLMKIDQQGEDIKGPLTDAGIAIEDCSDIHGLDSSYYRLSVQTHERDVKLIRALNRIFVSRVSGG